MKFYLRDFVFYFVLAFIVSLIVGYCYTWIIKGNAVLNFPMALVFGIIFAFLLPWINFKNGGKK